VDNANEVVFFQHGPIVEEVCKALDLHIKFDGFRETLKWTVFIPGIARGDGNTPEEAARRMYGRLFAHRGAYDK
jgi:hypothetical protein